MYTANNNHHHHQHRHSLDGSKPKPAGLKPLLLPIAFSPQLPSTPELGPLPLLDSSHHQHHPPVRRRCSPSWTRRSSFSAATALAASFSSSSSSSCSSSSSSSSSSASSYLGSSTCSSRMSHHQRQVSLESSGGDSPAFSFDSDSIASTDTLSSGSCVCSTSSPSSACASTPKPFRLPTRSLSASAATSSFSLPRSTERKSLLPHPPVSASTPVPSGQREQSRHARSITRSSISYSKSSFLPPIRPVRADPSSSPILLSPHDDPAAIHSSGSFLPFFPEHPASSDLPFNSLLDKLVAELVSCATELGLQDELVGILDL